MIRYSFLVFFIFISITGISQVGIGTQTPNNKSVLDLQATDKGVLFPRLTTAQRDAIIDPPNGLHIFNVQEKCLNYYDSAFRAWNCYCDSDSCKTVMIRIMPGCSVDFQSLYASKYPTMRKFVLLIEAGDTICGGSVSLNFQTLPADFFNIRLINRGVIIGSGGSGGGGSTGQPGSCYRGASSGGVGGTAIATRPGVTLKIENFGFIAAGGGGGGGGGGTTNGQYGGGGGGGVGHLGGSGGGGGGNTLSVFGSCGTTLNIAQNGTAGTITTPGNGGAGSNGGNGGTGGLLAQAGQPGTGANPGAGGPPGKAVSGLPGSTTIINMGTGQVLGVVD